MLTSPTSIEHITPVDLGLHDHKLESFVKTITEYKGKLDTCLVATAQGHATPAQCAWLQKEGFVKEEPRGSGVTTDTFANWVLGPFRIRAPFQSERPISVFPGWAAIGWNRNQYSKVSLEKAQEIKDSIDKRTLDPTVSDGYATWLKPLPVIVTGEGKHRADLHRQHGFDMLARIRTVEFPPAEELELVRVRWSTDAWALRCLNAYRIPETSQVQDELAYLPLHQLSIPLLVAYGVKTSTDKCWPWQVSLGLDTLSISLRLQPNRWRSTVLSSGYR